MMANWEPNPEAVAGEEGFSFEDSDRFDEESLCSWMSEPESVCTNWRGWRKQNTSLVLTGASNPEVGQVTPLMELCAQAVALHIPFEQVEKMFSPVPENVQLRIAYWSFPDNEEDIRLYSCLANGSPDEFQRGEHLVRARCVRNVLQIGFHLCANVTPPSNAINKNTCSVAVTFDRCRITSCSCNCGSSAKWCAHVVALCLVRIQQPVSVTLRAPVSESLSRLRREQLQKFAQYLISELPQQILPTAQRLLDELLSSQSTEINTLSGAPDPTAGPSMSDRSLWYLDESALNDNIKKTLVKFCGPSPIVYSDVNSLYLSSTEPPAAAEYSSLLRPLRGREPEGIWNLLSIVREMLKRRDSNAIPLLDIVTEQCLTFEQVAVWWYNTRTSSAYLQCGSWGHSSSHRPSNNISSEIAQHAAASMCDEIVALWRLVILDPSGNRSGRKKELKSRLQYFHEKTLEIIKRGKYKESHLLAFAGFKPAIDACLFDWDETEIVQCTHIIRKTKQTKLASRSGSSKTRDDDTGNRDNHHSNLGSCFYESAASDSRTSGTVKKKGRPSQAYRLALTRKHTDAGSASDDSCIERDIENLHLGNERWEVAESPLDFTSDDGSSGCSPVQFTLSSSDDNEQLNTSSASILDNPPDFSSSSKPASTEGLKSSAGNDSSGGDLHLAKAMAASAEDAIYHKYRLELDSLFTRAESLYTHGRLREACELSVKLAEEFLNNPEELIKEPESLQCTGNRKLWIRLSTSYACKSLERALFLCTVLSEHPRHHILAFRVGLHGLELKRLSASSKALEVKLFYQQGELAALMKRIPLGPREVSRLREKAHALASVDASQEFQHVLPLMLTTFVFDAFCQPPPPGGRNSASRRDVSSADQDSGFAAAVNALGFKVNVSEAEHPLLCEGTRKQKGELAMQMLILYKDQHHKLRMILQNFLDKSLASNLRASSAFPPCSTTPVRRPASTTSHPISSSTSRSLLSSSDRPGSSGLSRSHDHDPGFSVADDSTDDDDSRLEDRNPYSDVDGSLSGPHGDQKSSTSCDDDYPSSSTVCSPPRRDAKLSWRSPTVRPKRKQHCIANVNSSASEEAMLSDTSPRLRRRNLNGATSSAVSLALNSGPAPSGGTWGIQRYPPSPSSDSGSSSSADSLGTSSGDNKRSFDSCRIPQSTRSPPRPNPQANALNNSKPGYGGFRKSRGRNSVTVPDIPNQPSEAAAHFFFEVAKNVLVKAGGNSSTSLFMQQPQGNNQSGVHRNLVLAAFEIGLYALGLHNCVSPNWLSRTYSSHVSWITGQAMEIGSAALHILVDSWEGHLTPPETASLADRASRGRDSTTVRRAAELALSVLPQAAALNPNEISRALLQCKDQGAPMLEKACHAVEQAGRSGGVYPEVLFEVAKQWEWIHQKVNDSNENEAPARSTFSTSAPSVPASNAIIPVSTATGAVIPTIASAVSTQSIPVSVSGMVLPGGVITIQDPRMPPIQCHPAPIFHGFAPTMLDPQMGSLTPGIPPMQYAAAVQIHPAPALNLVPMPASNLHALQYHASRAPFLPDPHHHHPSALHHQNAPPIQAIPAINLQAAPISTQLQSAFRVGMLALDLLTKRTEDRPNNKYARNPPYANDVKWILKLSTKLGMHYVQQFCMAAVGGVSSPFVLQDIAVETAKFLSESNNQQVCTNLRAPFLQPIVSKCLQMYVHFIHNRLYHLHHASDHDEFVTLVHTARNAFCMTPGGILQFNEVLQSIHRSKACKKDLWQKINAGLSV
uniref:Zinc finger SWIM domain-containing protein 8 n=1 Tax=Phallusia mammillata TaxID=59560 RepID=A0A6F9DYF4_9ASCI|nr:zinc finger SWIM domain-containing protein 8 [Phallusia mammillata]